MFFKLAWRNIWRNKRRSLITIGSITFAVVLACFMRSMQLGSYDRMIENAVRFYTGYIQIHQNGYWKEKSIDQAMQINPDLIAEIGKVNGVEATVPRVESFALASFGQKSKGALVLGIDPESEDALTQYKRKIVNGHSISENSSSVLVSEGLAEYLKLNVGDTLIMISQGYHGSNAAGLYPISGIMKFPSPAQNEGTVFMSLTAAQQFFDLNDQLTSVALVIDQAKNTDRILGDLRKMVDTDQYEVMGWIELMPDLLQGIEIDNLSGKIMIWILYSVIGFGMFGTFMMMTAERMYEFGVMMSIGMKRLTMQFTVFLEMLLLTSIGVVAGVGFTMPFLIYYYFNPIYFTGESAEAIEKFGVEPAYFFSLDPSLFYNQAWAIFLMALILGFYPLYVISRLKPVQAMRSAV